MTRILMKPPRLSVLKQKSEEHDIFISYRREPDQDVANSIRCKLENNRYNVFYDHSSITDGKFRDKIINAIQSAPVFLLLISETSLDRCSDPDDIMRLEIETALKYKKKIIPVVKEPNQPKFPELPDSIKEISEFNVSIVHNNSFDSDIERIINERIKESCRGSKISQDEFYTNLSEGILQSNPVSVGKMISMIILAVGLVIILIKLLCY